MTLSLLITNQDTCVLTADACCSSYCSATPSIANREFFCSGIRCVALHRQPINSWIPHAPESVTPPHHLCYWLRCPRESQRHFFLQCLHLLLLLVHHLLQAELVLALMRVRRRKSHVEDDPCCSDHLFQLIKPCNSRVAAASAHVSSRRRKWHE